MADYDNRTTTSATAGGYDDTTNTRHHHMTTHGSKNVLDWLAIVLLIVGGLNWGLVGLFNVDLVATLFGQGSMISRVIYVAVGLAAIWGFALMRLSPANRHA